MALKFTLTSYLLTLCLCVILTDTDTVIEEEEEEEGEGSLTVEDSRFSNTLPKQPVDVPDHSNSPGMAKSASRPLPRRKYNNYWHVLYIYTVVSVI